MKQVSLLLALHNHQPVGNFDSVFESAAQKAYLPTLELWREFHDVPFSLHNSGVLWDWLALHHPYYLELANIFARSGQMELLTGGYYEPILAAISDADKLGQIAKMTRFLESRFGEKAETLWLTERVWEPGLPDPLSRAGVRAVLLDDEHFHAAGVPHQSLGGYFETEESGHSIAVFPILKELRYLIPFRPPGETIQFLKDWADESGERLAVLGDDGEKFGVWPDTYKTVFEEGWLREFLNLLRENHEWLHVTTPAQWMREHAPRGLVYLPSLSYHEMGEWALPTPAQGIFHAVAGREAGDPAAAPFVRGGFWRNFLSKYPESNRMHKRALDLSTRIRELPEPQQAGPLDSLWQAQCNCAYWHGVFGGLYLPHLRDAIHRRLLHAETALFEARGVDLGARELELRGQEGATWLLHNEHLSLAVAPQRGGMLLEWGDRRTGHDLQNTLARRMEGYHSRLREEAHQASGGPGLASIHERTRVKEAGLERLLAEDRLPRASFQDHFLAPGLALAEFRLAVEAVESGFAGHPYEAHLGWEADRVVLELRRESEIPGSGSVLRVTKVFTLLRHDAGFEVIYRVEHLEGPPVHCDLAVECNVTFLTSSAMDRWIEVGPDMSRVGMGHEGLFEGVGNLRLGDEWLDLGVELDIEEPSRLGVWPVETVSLSEDGFERNYQGTCLVPAWPLRLEAGEVREFRFEARHASLRAGVPLAPAGS